MGCLVVIGVAAALGFMLGKWGAIIVGALFVWITLLNVIVAILPNHAYLTERHKYLLSLWWTALLFSTIASIIAWYVHK